MASSAQFTDELRAPVAQRVLSKVPEVTVFFWIIKILATTVGETGADLLGEHAGLTTAQLILVFVPLTAIVLFAQFRGPRYVPAIYWLAVVLISVVGTLITDYLTDYRHISLVTTTTIFAIALAICFAAWWAKERTLSIHSIVTRSRESFYWLTVLLTFALGTAAGDLTAEKINIGYWKSALIFAGIIAVVFAAHRTLGLGPVISFWIAYVVTRPLGASLGDYLSQHRADGGLNLGTIVTSVIFLSAIAATVTYLSVTKLDQIPLDELEV